LKNRSSQESGNKESNPDKEHIVLRWILRICAKILRLSGYAVIEDRWSSRYLGRYRFRISTLIDVGVLDGTPVLYDSFVDSDLLLVDPIPDLKERCESVVSQRSGRVVHAKSAAGRKEALEEFWVDGSLSGLKERRDGFGAKKTSLAVQIRTLDSIVLDSELPGPYGLKIDTEGSEIDVIDGAGKTLEQTEFILLEVSLRRRFRDGYLFSDIVCLLASKGFEVADVMINRWHNRYVDVLFVKSDSGTLEPHAVPVKSL
jgi:FkbM family methyltransferase